MDRIDPVCGMKGHIRAHGHFFCSVACVKKFERKFKVKEVCPECSVVSVPLYKDKLFVVSLVAVLLFIISYLVSFLNPLFDSLVGYLRLIWWAVLIGLLLGGVIDYFVPREYIEKFLGQHRKRSVFFAVFFGFLMSACSHGILAISMELYKKGASTSSVVAFLLASPWANLPITVLFFGFFGIKALFIIFGAILIAIITGLVFQVLERKGLVECNKCGVGDKHHDLSIVVDLKKRFAAYEFTKQNIFDSVRGVLSGSFALSRMVLWWIIIGMIVASLANAFIPNHLFTTYMGATFLGMFVVLVLATIIEVCSEGSAPMAFELFRQTGAFGNSFVFLMAGVVTDYTEIGLIWQNIGRRAALWLPLVTVPQVLVLGYLFNVLL